VLQLQARERALIAHLRTPADVQRWLSSSIRSNEDNVGKTLRPFRGVLEHKAAHCLEGALAAAFILQHHGYPPLLLDLRSDDLLDHVLFLHRGPRGWGAVGKSRYPGLMGREPAYRSVRDLAWSYVDPYVDETGRMNGYATFDLRRLGGMEWALSSRNVWRIERALIENPGTPLRASDARHADRLERYRAWKQERPHEEPPEGFYALRATVQ
jgi:hypothetical protein